MANHSSDTAIELPRHVAIIMDGNGRWAQKSALKRVSGHKRGVDTLRDIVKTCAEKKIENLTVFAFSSENWQRPEDEVNYLMKLLMKALGRETKQLNENNVRIRIIGERDKFDNSLLHQMETTEQTTQSNTGLNLTVATDYGGQWDIVQACQKIAKRVTSGEISASDIDDATISSHLSLSSLPDPDLLIRTGGEYRISNFMLWQLAYSELYFSDVLWPDFSAEHLNEALVWYANRVRRFGRTSEQVTCSSPLADRS